jgi:hypothetical protein
MGIWRIQKWPGLQCHTVYIKFPESLLSDLEVEIAEYTVRHCLYKVMALGNEFGPIKIMQELNVCKT